MKIRCKWASSNPELATYHDEEWGVPILDDNMLFEHLSLGGAQAGLSWLTVLKRREGYRRAFASFDAEVVSRYSEKKIEKLLLDPGIIRNRLKVQSVVHNADHVKEIVKEYGSLEKYLWQFTRGKTIHNAWKSESDLPVNTLESDAMSKDLNKRGFKFTGTTICYAFMQAVGMVNDHTIDCFRYKELNT
jgi:DNA-3-methyladenine glycosylase I